MCKVKVEDMGVGLVASEKVVRISTGSSFEEVSVSSRQVTNGALEASFIAKDHSKVLIELPREAASGKWRLWVDESQVIR